MEGSCKPMEEPNNSMEAQLQESLPHQSFARNTSFQLSCTKPNTSCGQAAAHCHSSLILQCHLGFPKRRESSHASSVAAFQESAAFLNFLCPQPDKKWGGFQVCTSMAKETGARQYAKAPTYILCGH